MKSLRWKQLALIAFIIVGCTGSGSGMVSVQSSQPIHRFPRHKLVLPQLPMWMLP